MHKTALLWILVAGLAGCASTPAPASFGSFVQAPNPADDKAMADDAAKKLITVYPPARTRFNLQHATPDAFGTHLIKTLRDKGYAIAEVKSGMQAVPTAAGELSLAYIIDQPLDPGLYRVTILINKQTLSRAYQAASGALAPVGAWIRKEEINEH